MTKTVHKTLPGGGGGGGGGGWGQGVGVVGVRGRECWRHGGRG